MATIKKIGTIYRVVERGEEGARADKTVTLPGDAFDTDNLVQAAVVCEAHNLRHAGPNHRQRYFIESSNKEEDVFTSLRDISFDHKRVYEYLINEMGVEPEAADKLFENFGVNV